MTDKAFINFSKEYFGDLDYQSLSEEEYRNLYEQKEAERLVSMVTSGKLNLSLKAEGMKVYLVLNNKVISSATLVAPMSNTNILGGMR